ncbi:MAG: PIN domain-containing protein [Firmicutes bacterium]|nr:PIN domain-containing protein [Bacillota bacterium]
MIDTNVILDDILDRWPNAEAAREIIRLVTDELVNGYLTANCLTDIFYVVSKSRNEVVARKTVKNLLLSFVVVSVDSQDCQRAIDLPMEDFEDALVLVCAEKAALNYIITNDNAFLNDINLSVPTISPADFLLKLED